MAGPVEREILSQLFAAVPEEMGAVLVRSARSPNIRERRDSSAALFTAAGELIAQAAHIPVHLGAMPEAVAAVRAGGARADELWAWAHVHINRDLATAPGEITSSNMDAVLPKFEAALQENPDLAYARIMCPRKLDVSSTYHGFLIPVFESGRRAGLGLDPSGTPDVNFGSWEPDAGKPQADSFPYYFRWTFQTGTLGDFEYLVRLLEPQPVDSRVGRRDIDVQEPGMNLSGITDAKFHGVLRLGGALRVPLLALTQDELTEFNKYENWDQDNYPQAFLALQQGKVAAVTTDEAILAGILAKAPNKAQFEIPEVQISDEPYGLGMRKGDRNLVDFVNRTIVEMEKSGEAKRIFEKWFGPATPFHLKRNFRIAAGK